MSMQNTITICYRIHFVVGNACVKVWSTKLFAEYQRCIQDVEESTEKRCQYLSDIVAGTF